MENKFIVSSSPHLRADESISKIMRDVVIALLPATLAGVYFFRMGAVKVILASVIACLLTEVAVQKMCKKTVTINDWSAVVTGLLLAFNIPASAPLWIPVIGAIFAIAIVKQIFGGLGHNFMNPALAARAMLLASWPVQMTAWVKPGTDAVSTATPLAIMGGEAAGQELPSIADLIIGNVGGCIGETSAILLIIGGIYLVYRGVITPRIPVIYIATVAVLSFVFYGYDVSAMISQVFAGGLIIGAIYMATDYASSPVNAKGQVIFALGCGILTAVIRKFGGYPEGVSYSILLMNVAAPLIEKYTSPRVFGEVK